MTERVSIPWKRIIPISVGEQGLGAADTLWNKTYLFTPVGERYCSRLLEGQEGGHVEQLLRIDPSILSVFVTISRRTYAAEGQTIILAFSVPHWRPRLNRETGQISLTHTKLRHEHWQYATAWYPLN